MRPLDFQGAVTALKFDGDYLYAGVGPYICIYDWRSGHMLHQTKVFAMNKVHGIVVSNESLAIWGGRSLMVLSKATILSTDSKINTPNAQELQTDDWIISLCFGRQNQLLILTAHNKVLVFDYVHGKVLDSRTCSERSILYSGNMYYSPERTLVAAGTVLHGVVVWDLDTGKVIYNFTQHEGSIFYVAFSSDGKQLASCSDDRAIYTFDLIEGEQLQMAWGHGSRIWQLEYANNNQLLLSASEDITARVWRVGGDTNKMEPEHILQGHQGRNVWSLSTIEDKGDTIVATGGGDGRIKLWNISMHGSQDDWGIAELAKSPARNEHFKDYCQLGNKFIVTTSAGHVYALLNNTWTCLPVELDEFSVVRRVGDNIIVCSRSGLVLVFSKGSLDYTTFQVPITAKLLDVFGFSCGDQPCILLQSQNNQEPYLVYNLHGSLVCSLDTVATFPVTSIAYVQQKFILGSRHGALAVYSEDQTEPTVFRQVLGISDTITSIGQVDGNLLVTCRTGDYGLFVLEDNGLDPLFSNKLQKGSIEGFQVQNDSTILFFGFKTDKFFIWNHTFDYQVAAQLCGGAHRSWYLDIDPNDESKYTLFFTKAGRINRIQSKGNLHFKAPMLRNGIHGREIRGLEFSPSVPHLLATASEDTCVNLAWLENNFVNTKISLRQHVSGVQALHWSPCGKYLLTSGGREELLVWRVRLSGQQVFATEYARLPTSSKSPDLRIMDFSVLCQESDYIIATAYSDSTVRIWRFVATPGKPTFELLGQGTYRECCLLNINLIPLEDRILLLVTSTDGHLAVWSLDESWNLGQRVARIQIHQSGVRTSTVELAENGIFHFSGGDDNSLVGVKIDKDFKVEQLFHIADAHSSTVTSVRVIEKGLASTGCDQKVRLWSRDGSLLDSCYASVSDTGVLAVEGNKVVVAGSGLSVFEL